MKTLILGFAFVASFAVAVAAPAAVLNCEYSFYGAPVGSVRLEISGDGVPADTAVVALFSTPARSAPVTVLNPESGESLNIVLFKDDPQNEIWMKVFADGVKSKLINPSAPAGMKEIGGVCRVL
jgi:hypothetical protein